MFIIINKRLEELIRNSVSLKQKLTPEQIETFVDRAFRLPEQAQNELINILEDESVQYQKYSENMFQIALDIDAFDKKIQKDLSDFKLDVFKEAEQYFKGKDSAKRNSLMDELDEKK